MYATVHLANGWLFEVIYNFLVLQKQSMLQHGKGVLQEDYAQVKLSDIV